MAKKLKKPKLIRISTAYNPPGADTPVEHLAYINPTERGLLERISKGHIIPGRRGVLSFYMEGDEGYQGGTTGIGTGSQTSATSSSQKGGSGSSSSGGTSSGSSSAGGNMGTRGGAAAANAGKGSSPSGAAGANAGADKATDTGARGPLGPQGQSTGGTTDRMASSASTLAGATKKSDTSPTGARGPLGPQGQSTGFNPPGAPTPSGGLQPDRGPLGPQGQSTGFNLPSTPKTTSPEGLLNPHLTTDIAPSPVPQVSPDFQRRLGTMIAEGTIKQPSVYDAVFDPYGVKKGRLPAPSKPLSQMTVKEWADYQDQVRPKTGMNTAPMGAFQMQKGTIKDLVATHPELSDINDNTVMSPEVQDRLERALADDIAAGRRSLSGTWEGYGPRTGATTLSRAMTANYNDAAVRSMAAPDVPVDPTHRTTSTPYSSPPAGTVFAGDTTSPATPAPPGSPAKVYNDRIAPEPTLPSSMQTPAYGNPQPITPFGGRPATPVGQLPASTNPRDIYGDYQGYDTLNAPVTDELGQFIGPLKSAPVLTKVATRPDVPVGQLPAGPRFDPLSGPSPQPMPSGYPTRVVGRPEFPGVLPAAPTTASFPARPAPQIGALPAGPAFNPLSGIQVPQQAPRIVNAQPKGNAITPGITPGGFVPTDAYADVRIPPMETLPQVPGPRLNLPTAMQRPPYEGAVPTQQVNARPDQLPSDIQNTMQLEPEYGTLPPDYTRRQITDPMALKQIRDALYMGTSPTINMPTPVPGPHPDPNEGRTAPAVTADQRDQQVQQVQQQTTVNPHTDTHPDVTQSLVDRYGPDYAAEVVHLVNLMNAAMGAHGVGQNSARLLAMAPKRRPIPMNAGAF